MVVTLYIDFLRVEKNIIVQRSRRPAMFGVGMAEKIANSQLVTLMEKDEPPFERSGKNLRDLLDHIMTCLCMQTGN